MITNIGLIFWIFLAAGVLATIAILPYSLAINPLDLGKMKEQAAAQGKSLPPMPVMMAASIVQSSLLIAIAVFAGLRAAQAVGLRIPVLDALLSGEPAQLNGLAVAVTAGVLAGVALLALERFYFQPRVPAALHGADKKAALWKRALACFYGGIYEELLLRLFVMAGLIWLIGRVWSFPAGEIPLAIFWAANILSALLFGVGHLPATKRITPLTPMVVFRGLLLNGFAGLIFGWLFLRYGLEFAMIAHFTMDVIVHIVMPEIGGVKAEASPEAVG